MISPSSKLGLIESPFITTGAQIKVNVIKIIINTIKMLTKTAKIVFCLLLNFFDLFSS